ncbi:MAG: hypothetical protein RLZZ272_1472 [Actinomycetota bacterium]
MSDECRVRHDGTEVVLPAGTPLRAALGRIGAMRGGVIAARVEGIDRPTESWDLERELPAGATIEISPIASDTPEGRDILRHSTAHVMAQAVTDLFPGARWAIGPPIEDGFYYDFDVERPFTPEDLEAIEARMRELMRARQRFVRAELTREAALELFADQPYKLEVIERVEPSEVDLADGRAEPTFTVYRNVEHDGDEAWVDLCRGPHVPSTDGIPAFKLLRIAGAYWRGDETRPMLQRIYGTAWESEAALERHLELVEEARRRDHRRLGRELELVHFPEELGPGLAIFLPQGALVRKRMEDWIREETLARGYQPVYTPHIAKEDLWRISGHLENYADLMYPAMEVESASYRLKPMNCPFHILAYSARIRSYRELPIRIAELGTVYRYERSGVVNGMLRARGFTQDDSHIFCRDDQVVDEVVACIGFARDLYAAFGLGEPSRVAVSTRPSDKSIGSDAQWERAETALREAVVAAGYDYEVDEGAGAFYGPKIDVHARDALGREWQLTTIQVDFNLPERFDVTYVGEDGVKHRPFMVHRALFGSIERFFAVMLESTGGAFPLWLAPEQVRVVPVAGDFAGAAGALAERLSAAGLRVTLDASDDTLGARIRAAQTRRVAYTLVIGADEVASRTVAVRPFRGEQRRGVSVDEFVAEALDAVERSRTGSDGDRGGARSVPS